jgi:peptidoglycan/LPS O-acetylase OafA/YrhL
MATVSFELDQLFMLLVPELVILVQGVGAVIFPSEPDFVQNSLAIKSMFVVAMMFSLCANPAPKRRVFLPSFWHHAMAISSFKLDKLFMFHLPFLIMFRHGSQQALLSKRQKWVDVGLQSDKARCWQPELKVSVATTKSK